MSETVEETVIEEVINEGVVETQQPEERAEEVIVSIVEESPPQDEQKAPEWVRELRKDRREDKRRIRELEGMISAANKPETVQLSAKPTLEGCEYDSDKFESDLSRWYEQKRQVDEQLTRQQAAAQQVQNAWEQKLDKYNKGKSELKVSDFEEAEFVFEQICSPIQQGIVVQGAANSTRLIYAIGKNPQKAKELASISDPVEFSFAVSKFETMESKLSTTPKKPPPPEKTLSGSESTSGAVDSTLDRLRAEAERTGDYTKVTLYKRSRKT